MGPGAARGWAWPGMQGAPLGRCLIRRVVGENKREGELMPLRYEVLSVRNDKEHCRLRVK